MRPPAPRAFVKIRIHRIFRISFRPPRAFRNPAKLNIRKIPLSEDARAVKNPENPLIPRILILTIRRLSFLTPLSSL